jgi:fatty-acyl-CoA synthase
LVHAALMSHGSGLYIPAYVLRGARQVVPASTGFDADEFLDLCEFHPACGAFLPPIMVQRVVDTGRARPRQLWTIIYGGGPMYVESIKKALAAFGPIFAQIYGQGESPMTITGLPRVDHEAADDEVLGSVGYPRSGVQVAVLRDDGTPAAVGEIGEIVCRSDVVMCGYWNDPVARAPTTQASDTLGCSTVVAFIVGAVRADELDEHLLQRIARFKLPKRYVFVGRLPKNSYGKVLKREPRRQLA